MKTWHEYVIVLQCKYICIRIAIRMHRRNVHSVSVLYIAGDGQTQVMLNLLDAVAIFSVSLQCSVSSHSTARHLSVKLNANRKDSVFFRSQNSLFIPVSCLVRMKSQIDSSRKCRKKMVFSMFAVVGLGDFLSSVVHYSPCIFCSRLIL